MVTGGFMRTLKDVKVGEEEAKITLFLEDQGNNFHYYRKKNSGEKSA